VRPASLFLLSFSARPPFSFLPFFRKPLRGRVLEIEGRLRRSSGPTPPLFSFFLSSGDAWRLGDAVSNGPRGSENLSKAPPPFFFFSFLPFFRRKTGLPTRNQRTECSVRSRLVLDDDAALSFLFFPRALAKTQEFGRQVHPGISPISSAPSFFSLFLSLRPLR